MTSNERNDILRIYNKIVSVAGKPPVHLHEPKLNKKDIFNINSCIKSGYISSDGKFINQFEKKICSLTKSKYSVAVVNGTSALHLSLRVIGVKKNDEVLLPSLNFIAAANSIIYCDAIPHFIEISEKTLFIDEIKLKKYLEKIIIKKKNYAINKKTGRIIRAAIPIYTFGHMGNIVSIINILKSYNIRIVEDAAEALGSFYNKKHAGTFGDIGILSFNGNKIISTGGGGAIITDKKNLADKIRHISKVSKKKHLWKFNFDQLGFNYRLPNLNAALGCSQIDKIQHFLKKKRELRDKYLKVFSNEKNIELFLENKNSKSNYWLHTMIIKGYSNNFLKNFLNYCNNRKLFLRPAWSLLHKTKYLRKFPRMNLSVTEKLHNKIINLPSSCYK